MEVEIIASGIGKRANMLSDINDEGALHPEIEQSIRMVVADSFPDDVLSQTVFA